MNRENSKEHQKHISMELTANGARVTNLSLEGSRLILTIEAELADSQLRATAASGQDAIAAAFRPSSSDSQPSLPRSDTEFLRRAPSSPTSGPVAGESVPEAAPSISLGSENLPPAQAAFTPHPEAPKSHEAGLVQPAPLSLEPLVPAQQYQQQQPRQQQSSGPNLNDTQPIPGMGVGNVTETDTIGLENAPKAPPLEPVRELTETWDEPVPPQTATSFNLEEPISIDAPGMNQPAFANQPWSQPLPAAPVAPTSESAREIKLGTDINLPLVPAPAPAPDPAPVAPPAAKELRLGGEIPFADSNSNWAPPPPSLDGPLAPEIPGPTMESWDHQGGISLAPLPSNEPMAMTEESAALGGERHGEPLPAMSFGGGADAPAPQPAPAFGFSQAPIAPAPAAPAPMPAPAPAPAPAPNFALPPAGGIVDTEAPTLPDLPPLPALAPAPAPAPEEAKTAEKNAEAGGTTVLIRYTCPKCKTQGMQAVDKVGTVVNCSNCGKAMRLVMKK